MSVRHFTAASSEKITLGLGTLGFAFGPGTVAFVVKTDATFSANRLIFSAGASAAVSYQFSIGAAGTITLNLNAAAATGLTVLPTSTFCLVAATKATGTVAPRLHSYDFTAGTWVHEDSATSLANSSAPITRAAIGVNAAGTGNFFDSDIAAGGVWNVVLTDAQIETLLLFLPAVPKALWRLNQDTVAENVLDLTGNGASQTAIVGTSITSVTQPVGMMNLEPPLRLVEQALRAALR